MTVESKALGTDRVAQLCFITDDLERSSAWFAETLGVEMPPIVLAAPPSQAQAEYRGTPADVMCRARHFVFSNIDLEFIEPGPGPSTWRDWLEQKGPGFHHIAFMVDGMAQKSAHLSGRGHEVLQKGEFPNGRYAYLDTEKDLGAIIELLEVGPPRT